MELGYALALHKPCVVIGPRRNVFHHLCPQFESWEQWLVGDARRWER